MGDHENREDSSIKQNNFDIKTELLERHDKNNINIAQNKKCCNKNCLIKYEHTDIYKPNISEIYDALELTNCMEFINKYPEGINTLIGERGLTLSGGQKQRIAIARAIILKPAILILDEATSALDSESEFYIHKSLEKIIENKLTTILIISH